MQMQMQVTREVRSKLKLITAKSGNKNKHEHQHAHAQCRRQLSVLAAPSVIGLADLLGVAQHRSDQVGSLSTFGMSDVTVIVKTLPDEIPACPFGLHSSVSTICISESTVTVSSLPHALMNSTGSPRYLISSRFMTRFRFSSVARKLTSAHRRG